MKNTTNNNESNVLKGLLANLRKSHKLAQGTPCTIVKSLYIEAETEEGAYLRGWLLPNKQDLINLIPDICKLYNVGSTRKNGSIIKFSADMVLRYLSATLHKAQKIHQQEKRAKAKAEREAKKAEDAKAKEAKKALAKKLNNEAAGGKEIATHKAARKAANAA